MNKKTETKNNPYGESSHNELMSTHTSWKVGGPAKHYFQPHSVDGLVKFIISLPKDEQIRWLGLGSNTLVRDGGLNASVIATQGCLSNIKLLEDPLTIRAEAGVSCAQLARFCARSNLAGGEFWAGIPGTVGGALVMNAGCSGGETWEWVEAVETLDRQGNLRLRTPKEFEVAYRHVKGPEGEWFVAGHFRMQKGEKEKALDIIRSLLDRRAATQPTGEPNGGSVFRNPPGDYSARLIEASGLKGFTLGGASVSEKHANFIINNGDASAADIEKLITHVAEVVKEKHDISLITEVHIIGDEKPID